MLVFYSLKNHFPNNDDKLGDLYYFENKANHGLKMAVNKNLSS